MSERGALPKARLSDAHSSLFRRYTPYTCFKNKSTLVGAFLSTEIIRLFAL